MYIFFVYTLVYYNIKTLPFITLSVYFEYDFPLTLRSSFLFIDITFKCFKNLKSSKICSANSNICSFQENFYLQNISLQINCLCERIFTTGLHLRIDIFYINLDSQIKLTDYGSFSSMSAKFIKKILF